MLIFKRRRRKTLGPKNRLKEKIIQGSKKSQSSQMERSPQPQDLLA